MKRVKVMLTAIGVLAVVGGAVAFKAKAVGPNTYCVTSNLNSNVCNIKVQGASFEATGAAQLKYIQIAPAATCPPVQACTATGFIVF